MFKKRKKEKKRKHETTMKPLEVWVKTEEIQQKTKRRKLRNV